MKTICLVFFCALLCCTAFAQNTPSTTILLRSVKLYQSDKNTFIPNQDILIENGKVKTIGTKIPVPKGAQVIDLPNATVTPGLIDAHTHLLTVQRLEDNLATDVLLNSGERRVLRGAGLARSYLQSGFTTIRDLGNSGQYLDVELATAIRRGYVEGPQMLVSGPILSAMDGQFYQLPIKEHDKITTMEYRVIKGEEDARQAVLEHANQNVHVIKIVAFGERLGMTAGEMKAIVTTAHERGLKVTAHATGDWVIKEAVAAGVDGIEHGYSIEDSTLQLMAAKGVYLVPTDPSIQSIVDIEDAQHKKEHNYEEIKKMLQPLGERIKRATKAGVMIVAGSDAYFDLKGSRGDFAKQAIVSYWEQGLSVADVLKTATWNAAVALNRKNDLGIIQEKGRADITIFNGDLEKDFKKVLYDVQLVIKEGKIVYRKP